MNQRVDDMDLILTLITNVMSGLRKSFTAIDVKSYPAACDKFQKILVREVLIYTNARLITALKSALESLKILTGK